MEILVINDFVNCIMISSMVSILNMSLIQKFKEISFFNDSNKIFLLNIIFSFVIGISFSMIFYKIEFYYSVWVSIFSFLGASNIYNFMKKKKMINYNSFQKNDDSDKKVDK